MVQFNLLPYPPPGIPPGNLQLFSFLEVVSPPSGGQETIPHPRDPDRPHMRFFGGTYFESNSDFCTIAKRDVFRSFIKRVLELIEGRSKHVCS